MAFVQIIEMRTSKVEEMQRVGEEWEAAVGDDRTARRRVFCQDRENPDRYFNIVFFDSYESAMQNSEHPTTQKFSKRMAELVDGEPTFYNLDVLDERG